MIYLHPVLGALAVAAFLWIGTQGIRSRHARSYAPKSRAFHRRYAKVALILIVLAALGGTASVAFLRDDLKLSGSLHFWLGWGVATMASTLAWTGSQLGQDPDARRIHPALGYVALAVGALTFTFGLGLLP
jgi:hypothetical protein